MRRPRRRLEVSTFPFLAVLLCAMGSLILLLLILDRRAKAAARARAQETAREALAKRDETARAAAADVARRAGERAAERDRLRAALHEQLAHAKDEVTAQLTAVEGRKSAAARGAAAQDQRWRELLEVLGSRRAELAKVERETATTRVAAADAAQMSASARKQAARLSAELRGLEAVLDELKESRKRNAQTYSLMPYRGKRGDSRRPLYLECTADGLVFHPDRKTLPCIASPQEIRNEVDARVERQRRGVLAQGGQPEKRAYLLMLVRPNGIATYYATLGALKGKEVDFGYEFIDADWMLDFPDGDAAPAAQPWMTAQRLPVAPADPSAPTRKVKGLRPGMTDEFGKGDGGNTTTGSAGGAARAGSSDLPPLPGARGGGGPAGGNPGQAGSLGSRDGNGPAIAWAPVGGGGRGGPGLPPLAGASDPKGSRGGAAGPASGSAPGPGGSGVPGGVALGPGASGRPAVPNPDGALPGRPSPTPGGRGGTGQAGGTTGGTTRAGGAASGSPALFPFDRNSQPRTGAGSGGGGAGSGKPGNGQPGAATGGGQPSGSTGQPGSAPGSGSPSGAVAKGPAGGGQPHDPDEPRGPNLGAGMIPGPDRPSRPRPMRLIGNRDWVIAVECRPDGAVLRNQGRKFAPASLTVSGDNPLLRSLRQTIARRQATVRPGEPPYRPQVRCLIFPDGLKTYYLTLSAVEPLGIPVTRQKVEVDPTPRPSP